MSGNETSAAALTPEQREALAIGYGKARQFSAGMYGPAAGDDYADYLARHDAELLARGRSVVPWPGPKPGSRGVKPA